MESIEWTPVASGYNPNQVMGYVATVAGCKNVAVYERDVRCHGWNGIEWEVALDEHKWHPSDFSARGIAKNLEHGKQIVEKVLDFAVTMGWIPDHRVQA